MAQQHAQRPGKGHKGPKQGKQSKQRRDSLTAFLDPLTPKTFHKELKAEERLALRPQRRELQGEVRAEKNFRRKVLPDYFANYQHAVGDATHQSVAAYNDAYNKSVAAGQAASATDQAVRDKIEAAAKADAQMRGATYQPNSQSVDASANRQDSAGLIAATIAGQGANNAAYLADKSRIGAGELVDQKLKSRSRSRALNADKRAQAQSRRDFVVDYTQRAREAERSYALSQQQLATTRRGQKISAKTSRKNAALSAATTRRGQNLTRQSAQEAHAIAQQNAQTAAHRAKVYAQNTAHDNRHPSSSSSSGPHGKGQNGSGKNVQAAVADIRYYAATHDKKDLLSKQGYIDYLVHAGYPRNVAVAAVQRLQHPPQPGHTSPNAALHGG